MSMNGNWLRVTPEELARAKADLGWAHEFARTQRDGGSGRWDTTGKAWHGLDFLLDRLGFETPLVLGAESLVDLPDVRSFFAAAAEDGDAVVCWLD